MIGLTIPTRGDRPFLPRMIADSGLPPERVVVVMTAGREVDYAATIVRDSGEVNIHRWWNLGIDLAVEAGAEHVAVFNDDLIIPPGILAQMSQALTDTGASICFTGTPENRMTGWAFMLVPAHGIRPDERFRWWFGDNDLLDQANRLGGAVSIPTPVFHAHPNESTERSPELQALARADERTYMEAS